MELYKSNGTIAKSYSYAPFGEATQRGNITNPLQWSSEVFDGELGLVYYNYRHYIPLDGRWIKRDKIRENIITNNYVFINNKPKSDIDILGLTRYLWHLQVQVLSHLAHLAFGYGVFLLFPCQNPLLTILLLLPALILIIH